MGEFKKVLSEIEASRFLGVSRSFLAQARMNGQLKNRTPAPPFVRLGRKVIYLVEDLDNFLKDRRVKS